MAFLGGLGLLANLAQGYQNQQQQNQEMQQRALQQRLMQMQLQDALKQRQAQGLFARSLISGQMGTGSVPAGLGGPGGPTPDVSSLAPLAGIPAANPPSGAPAPGVPTSMSPEMAAAYVPIVNQRESGNQNIPNRQGPGGSPASSATGYAQELQSTWQEDAPKAGVDVRRYPTAMSAPAAIQNQVTAWQLQHKGLQPWATRSGNLHGAFAPGGGLTQLHPTEGPPANPPLPPPPGGYDIASLARSIERANPGIDDETLFYAVDAASQLMSRNTQQLWEQYKFQTEEKDKQEDFRIREADTQAQRAFMNQVAAGKLGQGQQKLDMASQNQKATILPDDVADMLAEQGASGDQSWKQNLGRGVQGAANIVKVQGLIKQKLKERGQTGADLATKEAEFGGLKAGERTLAQRTANIGMRINEAQKFAPIALAASAQVDRTQFPSLNRLIEAGLQGIGDDNVVRLAVATNSLLNAYAAAVTPTGTPTEGAQGRARELLDMAWSNGQFQTAVDQLMIEMKAAQTSPGAVREEFRQGADPGQSANPSGGLPQISGKAQYEALPSGAQYIWNGKTGTKP